MATRALQKDLDHPERMMDVEKHEAKKGSSADAKQAVMMLLKKEGMTLHSSMLTSLAAQMEKDPFAKVKKLIQELIERMLQEAANESNQKGWCDKALGDAKQKRDYTADKLASLNAEMAKQEARRDTLVEELATLAKEMKELKKAQEDADKERKKEKEENAATVKEAGEGLDAVRQAIDILEKFYKTAKKSEVLLDVRGPKDDMPDAGFDNGEAYKGAQGGAGGVVGMLEVIESDFVRTIKTTKAAEAQAKDDALEKLSKAKDGMDSKTELLQSTIKELLELQPACVDTGMSYQERVEARENEIKALKKALCIFEAFQEYGPDGAANSC